VCLFIGDAGKKASYFNLKDAGASDILGHELMIKASKFTPVDVMSP
jgi:hypothetical protein